MAVTKISLTNYTDIVPSVVLIPNYVCLHADIKPVLVANQVGQECYETDTGLWFLWDGAAWVSLTSPAIAAAVNLGALSIADGGDATQGLKADAAVTNPAAAGTVIGLLKGLLSVLGVTSAAAVITDAAGTVQQYLRGLIKLHLAGIAVTALPALPAGANTIGNVDSPVAISAGASRTTISCAVIDTDTAAAAVVPAGVVRALVQAVTNDAVIGNEATTATAGVTLRANQQYAFRVTPGDTLHAQSHNAGTVVQISYLKS